MASLVKDGLGLLILWVGFTQPENLSKKVLFNYGNRIDIFAISAYLFSLIMLFAVRLCRLVVPKVF